MLGSVSKEDFSWPRGGWSRSDQRIGGRKQSVKGFNSFDAKLRVSTRRSLAYPRLNSIQNLGF